MAITDEGSVLVLGAGSSTQFGLPLGGALIDIIAKNLGGVVERNELGHLNQHDLWLSRVAEYADEFTDSGYEALAALFGKSSPELGSKNAILELPDLYKYLSNQTSETIDDFIVENPKYAGIVKVFVAYEFFKILYRKEKFIFDLKPLSNRYFKKKDSNRTRNLYGNPE